MKHNTLLSFDDGLEVTYSDLKRAENGEPFITIYYKRPSDDGDIDSAVMEELLVIIV